VCVCVCCKNACLRACEFSSTDPYLTQDSLSLCVCVCEWVRACAHACVRIL